MLRMGQLRLFDHAGRSYSLQQVATRSNRPALRYAVLHLEASKTDPLRMGVDQVISAPAALLALCDYADRCLPTMLTASTPLFHFLDGSAVHRSWLMQQVEAVTASAREEPSLFRTPGSRTH